MESFSSASYSKWDDDHASSSQEWKTDVEMHERSARPDETSWRATREIRSGFSHEETHHDGTAQSVVNEIIPRDRPERPHGRIHFHPNTISSNDTFIQERFHPMTFSSKKSNVVQSI